MTVRKSNKRNRRRPSATNRPLTFSALEQRAMLATVSFDAGLGFLEFASEGGEENIVEVSAASDDVLQIQVGNAESIAVVGAAATTPGLELSTTSVANDTLQIDTTLVNLQQLTFELLDLADSFIVTSSLAGFASFSLTVNGGGGDDVLDTSLSDIDTTLNSGAGNDTLTSGNGDDIFLTNGLDTIDGGLGIDTVNFASAASAVIIDLDVNSAGASGVAGQQGGILDAAPGSVAVDGVVPGENILFEVNDIENVVGSDFGDGIFGNNEINVLTGGSGNDLVHGFGGNDFLQGGDGTDTVLFSAAPVGVNVDLNQQIAAEVFQEIVDGTTDATFAATGGAGDNVLAQFENITGSQSDDVLIGDANSNFISGNGGADTLVGNDGNDAFSSDGIDTIDGGTGTDTVDFSAATAGLIIDLDVNSSGAAGTPDQDGGILNAPPGAVAVDGVVPDENILFEVDDIENVTGSDFGDGIFGNNEVNVLTGGAGDDLIHGFAGNDFLQGGDGTDTVLFSAAPTSVVVDLNQQVTAQTFEQFAAGITPVIFAATGGAGDNVLASFENVTGSQNDDTLIGDENNNVLNGNGGQDILTANDGDDTIISEGTDTIDGGAGSDTVNFSVATAGIIVDLDVNSSGPAGIASQDGGVLNAPPAAVAVGGVIPDANILFEVDDVENVVGSSFNDGIFGNNEVNIVQAGLGDDLIHGFAGDDFLQGGDGIDTVLFSAAPSSVTVNLTQQVSALGFQEIIDGTSVAIVAATGGAGNNVLASFENITGSQSNDVLIGDNVANIINGSGGDDLLIGGSGADEILGGAGDDTIQGGNGTDTISGDTGNDTIFGNQGSDVITGDQGADQLFGGAGRDDIAGGADDDTILGGNGADLITGGDGDDVIRGGNGRDVLFGQLGNDDLFGGAGIDELSGGSGDDSLRGGRGADDLRGGSGQDRLFGDQGFDSLFGGSDDDRLDGGLGNDVIRGGEGDDLLFGDEDDDDLLGGAGDDLLDGGDDFDELFGGLGIDIGLNGESEQGIQ